MQQDRSTFIVAKWIFLGVGMLIIQVLLGGITRLTGSGLSITEWKPIMGAMPPLTQRAWEATFIQYQQIAQFKYINQYFSLADFKFIFFWEWFHRLWARLIGIVFLVPFLFFLIKKYFKDWMVAPLVILFLLGAMQGALGWIMVKSGLNDSDVYVNHIKLAVHFMAAMLLISYALVFGLKLTVSPSQIIADKPLYKGAIFLILLVSLQLIYGAFMAGLKAAAAAPTWPTINGYMIPPAGKVGFWNNIIYDKLIIHFIHRTLAYTIGIAVFYGWWKAKRNLSSNLLKKSINFTFFVVLLQIALGILTLLSSTKIVAGKFGLFEWMAQLHQLTGMLLLLSLTTVAYLTSKKKSKSSIALFQLAE